MTGEPQETTAPRPRLVVGQRVVRIERSVYIVEKLHSNGTVTLVGDGETTPYNPRVYGFAIDFKAADVR